MLSEMGTTPTSPTQRLLYEFDPLLEAWGPDNLYPNKLLADAATNPVLSNALGWVSKAIYAGGIEYGIMDAEGNFQKVVIPELDAIFKASSFPKQLYMGISSMKVLGNAFPEFILSKDRKKIVRISFIDASFCRWSKFKDNGHEFCYVDANWDLNFGRVYLETTTIPVDAIRLDGYGQEAQWMKEQREYKYIMPGVYLPTLGRRYYAVPQWASIRESGWLSYANQIPKFKEAYLNNASHIKYVIHVPFSWWLWKYPKFESLSAEERQQIRKEEHDRFDSFLVGYENAGKSIMLTYRDDPSFQQQGYTQWKIETIDKKVIEGILTDDVLETTQMIHTAVGVDGTLVGNSPGSKMGGGSGSDKREAFNIFMRLTTPEQEILFRPLEVMAEYNGYPNIKFRLDSRFLETLNQVTPSKRDNQDAVQNN